MNLRGLALLVIFTVATPLAHAEDRKRVAVLEFEGPRAQTVRGEVMRVVATKAWVSSASTLDGRSIRELAVDSELDLVVDGSVRKDAQGYHIRIRFFRGSTGRVITTAMASLRQAVLDRTSKHRVERELAKALAAIPRRQDDDAAFVRP